MASTFRLSGLPAESFAHCFALSDLELQALGASRVVASSDSGFPCRISLEDARAGEDLLLLSYLHQPAPTPYRASGPIYIRRHAQSANLAEGVVPPYVSRRLISLRAYDAADLMIDASVCPGSDVATALQDYFMRAEVAYVHLHNAKHGCYSCRADRVTTHAPC